MMIELRVLTGARAGHRARFEDGAITLGRHPQVDLQLDPEIDRDVSSRHAELRIGTDGTLSLADLGSTNGTFINGVRAEGTETLRDGDVLQLGGEGPKIELRRISSGRSGIDKAGASDKASVGIAIDDFGASTGAGGEGAIDTFGASAGASAGGAIDQRRESGSAAPRRPTTERVAIAVEQQLSKFRVYGYVALGLLAMGLIGSYWAGSRASAAEVAEMRRMLAGYDSTTQLLRHQLQGVSDTAAIARLNRANDSLRAVAAQASQGSATARAEVRQQVSRWRDGATAMSQVDLPAINDRNAPAVAFLVAEVNGKALGGTAFAVTTNGLMVTNRHLVRSADGMPASRLAVKFRDRSEWMVARVVRVAAGEDDDLALLELEDGVRVPAVAGIAQGGGPMREGAAVVTIGYPLGRSTRMDGPDGDAFVAKTSLYPGTVSKSLPTLLQVAAFAGHGSSGSPVFDAAGMVTGVVWGGPRESGGQLVYAVPAARVDALLRMHRR
ncbi:MAG: trypsin-like peptidase domain-containing protein [Gemmatimonadaceae bacterium]|nr:trypsin-like peptidase domain-containing protein [Gemmatimonadaceae bacterium]